MKLKINTINIDKIPEKPPLWTDHYVTGICDSKTLTEMQGEPSSRQLAFHPPGNKEQLSFRLNREKKQDLADRNGLAQKNTGSL